MIANRNKTERRRGRGRRFMLALVTISLSTIASLVFCELIFRVLEYQQKSRIVNEGPGNLPLGDARWGWKPSPGQFHTATSEFDVTGNVNSLWMNDAAFDSTSDNKLIRILALGDSHTFAVGVSTNQTWPKVLQQKLNAFAGAERYRVYNAGESGYNMHQYLLRLMDQGPTVRPDYVVLGLSYATDLYDLLPPDHGGWEYGGGAERDYFDFDAKGDLTLRHWKANATTSARPGAAGKIRQILEYSAAFRYLRRSSLALSVGSHVKINGQSLWPNMDVVLERNVSAEHEYQWRLFGALLRQMKEESDRQKAKLIVVGIPYLPQVYDDVWNSTFAGNAAYSRTAAIERVEKLCRELGIAYVDTLEPMRERSRELGHWLHYAKDAHPTPEGQEVIADTVFKNRVVVNQTLANFNR